MLGNKTEGALLVVADKYGVDYDMVRSPIFRGSLVVGKAPRVV